MILKGEEKKKKHLSNQFLEIYLTYKHTWQCSANICYYYFLQHFYSFCQYQFLILSHSRHVKYLHNNSSLGITKILFWGVILLLLVFLLLGGYSQTWQCFRGLFLALHLRVTIPSVTRGIYGLNPGQLRPRNVRSIVLLTRAHPLLFLNIIVVCQQLKLLLQVVENNKH